MKIEIITEADNSPVAEFFSSSNTPETDAAQHEGLLKGNPMPTRVVHVNFARKLERERDEAREQLCMANIESNARQEIANALEERDEARKESEYYKARYEQLNDRPKIPKWYNGREIPADNNEDAK